MMVALPRAVASWWRGIDRTLLFVILALIITGIVLSMASSPAAAGRVQAACVRPLACTVHTRQLPCGLNSG